MAVNLPDPPSVGETGHVSDTSQLIAAIQHLDDVKVEALTIGTVATGGAGTEVVASITDGTTLNLQIPKGDKGTTGDPGDKGDPGDQGDPGEGIPTGGIANQVLVKASSTDYDADWGDVAQANVTGLVDALADKESVGHAVKHGSGGSDEITIAPAQVTGTAVVTGDSRLSNARTPTAHASTHQAAGSDPLSGISASQVTGTAVIQSRTLTSGNGLTGGGDLSADRTLAVGAGTGITVNADDVEVKYGTTAGTAAQGNDSRITGAIQSTVADANSVLYAVTDNTPAALAVSASRIVGRKATGDIAAMTAAESLAVLGLAVTHPNTDDVLVTVAGQTVHYDSGWRSITSLLVNSWTATHIRIRRVNATVFCDISGLSGASATNGKFINGFPSAGFIRTIGNSYMPYIDGNIGNGWILLGYDALTSTTAMFASFAMNGCLSWPTNDAIPTSLPGTLVSAAPA